MQFRLSALLLLFAFTQSYVWTRKKKDRESLSSYQRPARTAKKQGKALLETSQDSQIIPTHTTTIAHTMIEVFSNGDWTHGTTVELTHEECAKNVDLGQLVCPKVDADPSCTLFSAVGTRVISCQDLRVENSVFVVPKDRIFMLPTKEIGHVTMVDHIELPTESAILLETLSVEPRVFRLSNFISLEEADLLVAGAQGKLRDASLPPRGTSATTGTHQQFQHHQRRAVDSYLDVESPTAVAIKYRLFDLLGIYPFQESYAEGLQILRYNESGAYFPHLDWIDPLQPQQHMHHASHNAHYGSAALGGGDLQSAANDSTVTSSGGKARDRQGHSSQERANLGTSAESMLDEHDYDSSSLGTNRYVTLILYLSDVEEGGETLFSELPLQDSAATAQAAATAAATNDNDGMTIQYDGSDGAIDSSALSAAEEDALLVQEMRYAMQSGSGDITEEDITFVLLAKHKERLTDAYLAAQNATFSIHKGSWEHDLLGECRTHVAHKPVKAQALLFYSQYVDGAPNFQTKHGGCPVIRGTKYVANMWVWNGPRAGSWSRNSVTGKIEKPVPMGVSASFECVDIEGAQLYWEDQYWEPLPPGRTVKVNTYHGHRWHIRVDEQVLLAWVIDESKPNQRFIVSAAAMDAATAGESIGVDKKGTAADNGSAETDKSAIRDQLEHV